MTRGRHEVHPETLHVVDRTGEPRDLELAPVARPRVDLANRERSTEETLMRCSSTQAISTVAGSPACNASVAIPVFQILENNNIDGNLLTPFALKSRNMVWVLQAKVLLQFLDCRLAWAECFKNSDADGMGESSEEVRLERLQRWAIHYRNTSVFLYSILLAPRLPTASSATEVAMVDRDKVLAVLKNWFPDASDDVAAGAANAIVGLGEEWDEVTSKEEQLGYHYSPKCVEICYLADQVDRGAQFRLFRKRPVRNW